MSLNQYLHLKLSNKYVKMSIIFEIKDKYAAYRQGGTQ